jgi:hypothetical protein
MMGAMRGSDDKLMFCLVVGRPVGAVAAVVLLVMASLDLPLQARPSDVIPLPSTVVCIRGHAECAHGIQGWRPLQPGEILLPGTTIRTGPDSAVDLLLGGKQMRACQPNRGGTLLIYVPYPTRNLVRLLPNSILSLDRVEGRRVRAWSNSVERIQLTLTRGTLTGDFPLSECRATRELVFPGGVAHVYCGFFELNSAGAMVVYQGNAAVSIPERHVQLTLEGPQGLDPVTGVLTSVPYDGRGHLPAMYGNQEPLGGAWPVRKL